MYLIAASPFVNHTKCSSLSEPGLISEVIIKDINMSSVLITWTPPESDLWDIDGYIVSYPNCRLSKL